MTAFASCRLQAYLDEAVDKHDCGSLCTVLRELLRAHSARIKATPHGLFMKAFSPLRRCSSPSASAWRFWRYIS